MEACEVVRFSSIRRLCQGSLGGKRGKPKHRDLFRRCYLVEQFNGLIKSHVLRGCWIKPRGIVEKASVVTAALISLNATAIEAILEGVPYHNKLYRAD